MKVLRYLLCCFLDFKLYLLRDNRFKSLDRASWLKESIQRAPYWRRGQLAYAKLLIESDNPKSSSKAAYGAGACALALSKTDSDRAQAWHIQARALLMTQQFKRSKELLERAITVAPDPKALYEDLAAALLALEQYDDVERLLSELGPHISQGAALTLRYVRQKMIRY